MKNVVEEKNRPDPAPRIKDMRPGNITYTMPWKINNGILDTSEFQNTYGGTCTIKVICVERGKYKIEYSGNEIL